MTHMVFMKFETGFLNEDVVQRIGKAFDDLQEALPEEILRHRVLRNCIDRDTNLDLLIELELRGRESLAVYLHHPIHAALGALLNPHITGRYSFDYN